VSADVGVRTPGAAAFRVALRLWSLPAVSVALFGDSLFHVVDGANRMGLYSIHLTQLPNPGDAPHRGSIEPRLAVASHEALREALEPLLSVEA
jgi:FMN phosphatase YigB (HAD superfamily)